MTPTDPAPQTDEPAGDLPAEEVPFRLSPGWAIVGLLAVLIGIGCGLVMSSATFSR
jgi:hypothetical protein